MQPRNKCWAPDNNMRGFKFGDVGDVPAGLVASLSPTHYLAIPFDSNCLVCSYFPSG